MTDETKHVLYHEELPQEHSDPLIRRLHQVIRVAIRVLAIMMVAVIFWGVADVVWLIYQRLMEPPLFLLDINDLFQVFGGFMVVLIAIEIFINIRLYLGSDVLPIQLVIGTALMAIARKMIILDLEYTSAMYLMAMAASTLALGVTYYLVSRRND